MKITSNRYDDVGRSTEIKGFFKIIKLSVNCQITSFTSSQNFYANSKNLYGEFNSQSLPKWGSRMFTTSLRVWQSLRLLNFTIARPICWTSHEITDWLKTFQSLGTVMYFWAGPGTPHLLSTLFKSETKNR